LNPTKENPSQAQTSKHFWNWGQDEEETRTLYLQGVIAEESWFSDEVTPALFKAELLAGSGDITVWINSVGGDCIAAAQIYNMLMEYPGKVTVKIDGIAASAASVVAMAGTEVLMSPAALLMVHNPFTVAIGDSEEMKKAIQMLDEVKESIINAYALRTGMSRVKLANLMDAETWLNVNKAVEYGFADGILFQDSTPVESSFVEDSFIFSRRAVTNSLLNKITRNAKPAKTDKHVSELEKRLDLLKY
jgi:ATP-dependent Clp protease protease subunit